MATSSVDVEDFSLPLSAAPPRSASSTLSQDPLTPVATSPAHSRSSSSSPRAVVYSDGRVLTPGELHLESGPGSCVTQLREGWFLPPPVDVDDGRGPPPFRLPAPPPSSPGWGPNGATRTLAGGFTRTQSTNSSVSDQPDHARRRTSLLPSSVSTGMVDEMGVSGEADKDPLYDVAAMRHVAALMRSYCLSADSAQLHSALNKKVLRKLQGVNDDGPESLQEKPAAFALTAAALRSPEDAAAPALSVLDQYEEWWRKHNEARRGSIDTALNTPLAPPSIERVVAPLNTAFSFPAFIPQPVPHQPKEQVSSCGGGHRRSHSRRLSRQPTNVPTLSTRLEPSSPVLPSPSLPWTAVNTTPPSDYAVSGGGDDSAASRSRTSPLQTSGKGSSRRRAERDSDPLQHKSSYEGESSTGKDAARSRPTLPPLRFTGTPPLEEVMNSSSRSANASTTGSRAASRRTSVTTSHGAAASGARHASAAASTVLTAYEIDPGRMSSKHARTRSRTSDARPRRGSVGGALDSPQTSLLSVVPPSPFNREQSTLSLEADISTLTGRAGSNLYSQQPLHSIKSCDSPTKWSVSESNLCPPRNVPLMHPPAQLLSSALPTPPLRTATSLAANARADVAEATSVAAPPQLRLSEKAMASASVAPYTSNLTRLPTQLSDPARASHRRLSDPSRDNSLDDATSDDSVQSRPPHYHRADDVRGPILYPAKSMPSTADITSPGASTSNPTLTPTTPRGPAPPPPPPSVSPHRSPGSGRGSRGTAGGPAMVWTDLTAAAAVHSAHTPPPVLRPKEKGGSEAPPPRSPTPPPPMDTLPHAQPLRPRSRTVVESRAVVKRKPDVDERRQSSSTSPTAAHVPPAAKATPAPPSLSRVRAHGERGQEEIQLEWVRKK